jgi:hypothetical protein
LPCNKGLSEERLPAHSAYVHFHVNRTVKGKCSLSIDCINILSGISGCDEGLLKMFPESWGEGEN